MRRFLPTINKIARLVLVLVSFVFSQQSFGQSDIVKNQELKSRVSIVAEANQTKIWISDFPKNTSVVIFDNELNLLTLTSTNAYGAAFINLNTALDKTLHVKTLNGEIVVTSQPFLKASDTKVNSNSKTSEKA